jgi:flagellar biosynthesis anti-sigma factor FlgM
MRITDAYSSLGAVTSQPVARAPQGRPPAPAEAPEEGVRVQLSAQSVELSKQSEGEVDAARVARLKSAIESGSFQVDARAIAEKLVRGG